jgi:hypothetical protein
MLKKLVILFFLYSVGMIPKAIGVDEPAQNEKKNAEETPELDPIKRLKKAYALRKKSVITKQIQKPDQKKQAENPSEAQAPTFIDRLRPFAQSYFSDAFTGYSVNLLHAKFIQQGPIDHPALMREALFDALRIPHILDLIYRIPFKIALYGEDDENRRSEEYLIARTFIEDTVVDYAVGYTYVAGICKQKVDHRRLLVGALIHACRLPFIADCTTQFFCNSFIQN